VAAGDPADWTRAVGQLLAGDRDAARAAARASAEGYGWDRTFTALLGVYREAGGCPDRA
jgi:hypothetical protein